MPNMLVHEAGPQTTVQDLGRRGSLRAGIPPSGPMDREAFLLANRLVGNAYDAAALECDGPASRSKRATCCVSPRRAQEFAPMSPSPAGSTRRRLSARVRRTCEAAWAASKAARFAGATACPSALRREAVRLWFAKR